MKTARFVKRIEGWRSDARLYHLSEKVNYDNEDGRKTDYVIVSAVIAEYVGAETYIFPAKKDGEAINFGELNGSYRGGLSHREALKNAGFSSVVGEV